MNPQLDVSSILLNFPHDSLLTGTQKKSFGDLKMLQLESVFLWESNACLKLECLFPQTTLECCHLCLKEMFRLTQVFPEQRSSLPKTTERATPINLPTHLIPLFAQKVRSG
jgi:hypothetical protein